MARFIDLFAGLGGFHKALKELGHKCVFACEIDSSLRTLYKQNWGIEPLGDIKEVIAKYKDFIPEHDILCAGFPCQPFSKAGKQAGLLDEERGTLFDDIAQILSIKKPTYFILENVPHIKKHDDESTWQYMHDKLSELEYSVDYQLYSPHQFGIPQHRQRIFIVGSRIGLDHFSWVSPPENITTDIKKFINGCVAPEKIIDKEMMECLAIWQRFLDCLPKDAQISACPIWAMEFGATYPFEENYPHQLSSKELANYKGSFGIKLSGMSKKEQLENLPSYARDEAEFPGWKKHFIRWNRDLYKSNKRYIEDVIDELKKYNRQSWQKLEWNVKGGDRVIRDYIIQFRASGIRVKRTNFFPSLVCTKTQVPIIGWQNRYITKEEGARLQSLDGIILPENDNSSFRALGNAVNANIVKLIAQKLIKKR